MNKYVFELNKTGERYRREAENSDVALDLCLKETGWAIGGVVYLGRASFVDSPDFLKVRDEIKYIPGRSV